MSSPTSKPSAAEAEEAQQPPDIIAGDEVFFDHPQGPMSGKVICCGEHGATIKCGAGVTHKMKWPHILGLKKRAQQHYNIHDSGEDGHIVKDANGQRRYIAVPNEATEDPLVAKAQPGGGGFAGRPGLQKKVITEKSGKRNTHWVRSQKDQPKDRKPAAAKTEPHPNAGKTGDKVKFKAGDFDGEGTIVGTPGSKGAYVRDSSGRDHKVKWDEVKTQADYAERTEGETDKAYAKRAVDTRDAPKHLPEEHDKYFHTEGSQKVAMENIHSSKTDAENKQGGDNAPKRMEAALHGKLPKRPPITVAPHPDKPGHYKVLDGNGTHTAAKAAGWKHMPVNVVKESEHKAKEIAKKVVDPAEHKALPKKALQPANTQEALYALAAPALNELKDWLDRGSGVASKAGFQSMTKPPEDVTPEEYAKPGGMLFVAPVKGAERAAEKVESDYDGNWNQLTDAVRCTLAVDDLNDMADIMESLKASGMKLAQQPKNKFLKPTEQGYSDVNLVVTLPNGMHAEVQLNVKDMLVAKNEGHKFYEITRKLDEKNANIPDDQWSPEDDADFEKADAEQRRIYGDAWGKHVEKHYGTKSNMIKSLRRVLIFRG